MAFPTETVYGLGAAATDRRAVKNIFIAKGRPADNPLIVHVAGLEQVKEVTSFVPRSALEPVSYTHLDVYKRQAPIRSM